MSASNRYAGKRETTSSGYRYHVLHVGNSPGGHGGIASVIRQHLGRTLPCGTVDATPIVSYDQDATTFWLRNKPAIRAAISMIRTRPSNTTVLHFHLSQRGSLVREGALAAIARFRGHSKLVATLHGSSWATATDIEEVVLRRVLRMFTILHVLSTVHAEILRSGRSRVVIIPNDTYLPRTLAPLHKRDAMMLFVGVVGYRKGVDLLLEAWNRASLAGWSLVLCGPVDQQDPMSAQLCRDISISPNVEWLGPLEPAEIGPLLQNARIVVLPSRAEAFPMALCEALAYGCAVIASDVGGVRELLGQTNAGLIPANDVGQLSATLEKFASALTILKPIAVENRIRAEEMFDPCRLSVQWEEAYLACVRRSNPSLAMS